MAWDAPCREFLDRHLLRVDDVEIDDSHNLHHTESSKTKMGSLSPVEEEPRVLVDAPLQVNVTARFHDPAIRSVYRRTYLASQSFSPTERIRRGLVRRIDHCSKELITRKDSDALNPVQCHRQAPKSLRFELAFEVHCRDHSGPWAKRVFRSYQKRALTSASVKDIIRSTHSIVGMFLRRHDKDFELKDEPEHDYFPNKPETFAPSRNGPLNLACVPRSLFIESTQAFEFVPGYSVELAFKSTNPARHQTEISRTLRVDSSQTAPLILGLAEDLLWQAHRTVQDVLDQKKTKFDLEHGRCDNFEVPDCDCQQFDEVALDVDLRIVNNLGPVYEHLHRSFQSRLRLFNHPMGQDCNEFVGKISGRFDEFVHRTDKKIERLIDFDFRIVELTGHGWHEKNCARFVIDGMQNHSRRSIEALLDRIRTGVCDVLRGHDVAIRMIAYKRGHLVLDKALIARDHQESLCGTKINIRHMNEQRMLINQLEARVQQDIDMICKDTCNLDHIIEETPPSPRVLRHMHSLNASYRSFTPRSSASQSLHWVRPGSPGSFASLPPTPPDIPPRKSSIRVFPLVPAKYSEENEPLVTETTTVRDSTCSASLISLRLPSDVYEGRREAISRDNHSTLRPAAEVYRAFKVAEDDTDASSTHSSMPALTESDTPSPEQSLLITPSFVRSCSPSSHDLPYHDDSDAHHLPGPVMIHSSAPNSSAFSEMERFPAPKAAEPRPEVSQRGRPVTPRQTINKDSLLSVASTPKSSADTSGDEKTPLAHPQLQESVGLSTRRSSATEPSHHVSSSARNTSDLQITTPCPAAVGSETDRSLAEAQLPNEGFLLCCAEEDEQSDCEFQFDAALAVAECDSSETLRPSTCVKQRSIDEVAGLWSDESGQAQSETETTPNRLFKCEFSDGLEHFVHNTSSVASEPLCEAQARVAEQVKQADISRADAGKPFGPMEDEMCRTKPDFFEQDEDGAIDSGSMERSTPGGDAVYPAAEAWLGEMSESSEIAGQSIPFSDSEIDIRSGSEASWKSGNDFDDKRVLPAIDENAFEVDALASSLREPSELAKPKQGAISGPLDKKHIRHGEEIDAANIKSESTAIPTPEIFQDNSEPVEQVFVPVPTPASESLRSPKTRLSAPHHRSLRAVSSPQPSPTSVGLRGNHLLPPLPIFSGFATSNLATADRNSWSSSSSWEDCVSVGRQSNDSVDTIQPTPSILGNNDLDSGKRLGTPTAGLLGLHESRWAELGLRTVLTGTHAFDRPTTAPPRESPEGSRDGATMQNEPEHLKESKSEKYKDLSLPRKAFHIRHKTSIGSIFGSRLAKESKESRRKEKELRNKESKELRSKESKELKKQENMLKAKVIPAGGEPSTAHDDGRFPRAMMLVAGLAFASSIVSRNTS